MESRFFSSPIITIIFVFFILKLNPWLVLAKTHHHHHHHDDRPCHFPAIFNFGDSNSDTGGLSALFSQAPPPNGISFFGHPAGRFCDGRLIIDFIGFKQPLRTCCGHGGKYNYNIHVGCGGKKEINGTQVLIGKACKDPSTSVVWDGVHLTQAANKYIFDRILDGSFSDPPTPLNMACRYTHQIYSLLSSTRRLLAHS